VSLAEILQEVSENSQRHFKHGAQPTRLEPPSIPPALDLRAQVSEAASAGVHARVQVLFFEPVLILVAALIREQHFVVRVVGPASRSSRLPHRGFQDRLERQHGSHRYRQEQQKRAGRGVDARAGRCPGLEEERGVGGVEEGHDHRSHAASRAAAVHRHVAAAEGGWRAGGGHRGRH
jgi:hypothetical protein